MRIRFVFIGEGSSDTALVPHLEELCILAGAEEATGVAPDLSRLPEPVGKTVEAQLRAVLRLEPEAKVVFVHRDANGAGPELRREEVARAVASVQVPRHVAVVPVQELEAWMLLDEVEIRRVAENPRGRVPLDLPKPSQVETIRNPKEVLNEAILLASEQTGRRREKIKKRFGRNRRILLQRLDPEGLISQVPAWKRLRADVSALIASLAGRELP